MRAGAGTRFTPLALCSPDGTSPASSRIVTRMRHRACCVTCHGGALPNWVGLRLWRCSAACMASCAGIASTASQQRQGACGNAHRQVLENKQRQPVWPTPVDSRAVAHAPRRACCLCHPHVLRKGIWQRCWSSGAGRPGPAPPSTSLLLRACSTHAAAGCRRACSEHACSSRLPPRSRTS